MNNKSRIVLVMGLSFFIVLSILLSLYAYTNHKVKIGYSNTYNACIERNMALDDGKIDLSEGYPDRITDLYRSCIERGGCFIECGSACGRTVSSISFWEMFDYYFDGMILRDCPAVCVPWCILPPE